MNWKRIFAPLALVALAAAAGGCGKSDPRVAESIEALRWTGGNAEDRRVRDALASALEKSNAESLKAPTLVSVSAVIAPGHGNIQAHWIGTAPLSDGVRITLPGGEFMDLPFDADELAYLRETSRKFLVYDAAEFAQRDQPAKWDKLMVAGRATAVLTLGSKAVSNPVPVVFYRPPAPATAAAAKNGKMIGAIDGKGKATIFTLRHAVKAGDKLAPADVDSMGFSVESGGIAGIDSRSLLDTAGLGAYVGRPFLTDQSINEALTTDMFSGTGPAITQSGDATQGE